MLIDDIVALRARSRARAATRRPGPPMATEDRLIGGVPVRVYRPDARPVVVYLHGGGFVLCDLETHDSLVRRLAAATGACVVAVDYRLAPEHAWPAAVDDAVAVITALASGDRPVAVAGDSAGGMLAVLAALRLPGLPLLALLLMCPNADPTLSSPSVTEFGGATLRAWIDLWLPDPAVHTSAEVNLLAADLRGLPPTLLVTAERDALRDEGDALAARLTAAGVPVRHWREAGAEHNFPTLRDTSPEAAAAEDRYLHAAADLLRGGRGWLADTRSSYDTVATAYADQVRDLLAETPHERAALARFAGLVRGGPVVDVGCGSGRITAHLHGLGVDAFGIDLSPKMVEVARSEHPGLTFDVGSMTELDLADESVAGLVAWYSLIHIPDEELGGVLHHFWRVLRPGGPLLIGFHVGDESRLKTSGYGGHPMNVYVHRRRPERMAAWLADAGFVVESSTTLTSAESRQGAIVFARRQS
ncbi:alpha/beta hydrolase fold domain-containing protein [Asanoa sp. NPDC049518]|uniref:alpha/beta hydrolase fold domain-containing protein n=1 Tax=unclassified Asanoa TaxID=2685164 RepID=UPI0034214A71